MDLLDRMRTTALGVGLAALATAPAAALPIASAQTAPQTPSEQTQQAAPAYSVDEGASYFVSRIAGALYQHDHGETGWGSPDQDHVLAYLDVIGKKVDVDHNHVISTQEAQDLFDHMVAVAEAEKQGWNQYASFMSYGQKGQ